MCPSCLKEQPTALPFWPEPDSIFGSLGLTTPEAVHFSLGMSSSLSR